MLSVMLEGANGVTILAPARIGDRLEATWATRASDMTIRLDHTSMMAPPMDGGITAAEWTEAGKGAPASSSGARCPHAAAPDNADLSA